MIHDRKRAAERRKGTRPRRYPMSILLTTSRRNDMRPLAFQGMLATNCYDQLSSLLKRHGDFLAAHGMPDAGSFLAEPVHDPRSGSIDWYTNLGGEARKLSLHAQEKKGLCGNLLQKAITYAMATLETNASMGLIVASPTAGSAGIVPGLMLAMQEHYQFSDEEIIRALFNASAIGYLAMRNATVAGAVGGCQAEVGVASAMAASAAVELMGGSPKECTFAASTVLMNMLGLVCDPVGGLVEYPCQNRNAAGVANAIIAAEMALAGIPQLIPLDEMIQTMFTVGKKLPAELRETAMGGCATTPSACEACHICS